MSRRFQFSLRALLVVVTLIAIGTIGATYLPPNPLLAAAALAYCGAWLSLLGLPVLAVVICLSAGKGRRRKMLACLVVVWLLAAAFLL